MTATIHRQYPAGDIMTLQQVIDRELEFVETGLTLHQTLVESFASIRFIIIGIEQHQGCLLSTSDAADDAVNV